MSRLALLVVISVAAGCIHRVDASRVVVEEVVAPPSSLIPAAAGRAFGDVVSICRGASRGLSDFAGEIGREQQKASTVARWFSIGVTTAGAGTALLSDRFSSPPDNIRASNAALFGGLVGVVLGAPAAYYGFRTDTQGTEQAAARTAAQAIEAAVASRQVELMKAADLNPVDGDGNPDAAQQTADRSNHAWSVTAGLQADCNAALVAANIRLKSPPETVQQVEAVAARMRPGLGAMEAGVVSDQRRAADEVEKFLKLVAKEGPDAGKE